MTELLTLIIIIVGAGFALKYLAPSKFENIKKNILAVFRNENNIKQVEDGEYSRKNLTKKLVNLLEKL